MSAAIPELKQYDEAELDRVFGELDAEVAAQTHALTSDEAMEAFRLEWLGRKQGRLGQLSAACGDKVGGLGARCDAAGHCAEDWG
jgi:phenylalanyl-tRNA synthetase alpha chain